MKFEKYDIFVVLAWVTFVEDKFREGEPFGFKDHLKLRTNKLLSASN